MLGVFLGSCDDALKKGEITRFAGACNPNMKEETKEKADTKEKQEETKEKEDATKEKVSAMGGGDSFFLFIHLHSPCISPISFLLSRKECSLPFAAKGRPRRSMGEMKEGNFLFFFLFHIKICTMHLSHFFFIILRITNERNEPSVRSNSAETNGRDAGDR